MLLPLLTADDDTSANNHNVNVNSQLCCLVAFVVLDGSKLWGRSISSFHLSIITLNREIKPPNDQSKSTMLTVNMKSEKGFIALQYTHDIPSDL